VLWRCGTIYRPLTRSWLRAAGSFGLALPLLIVLLSGLGYVVTSETVRSDRDSDVARRVEVDTVGAQVILGRAQAYVMGLGSILAGDPVPGQRRFVQLAGGTAGGVGLLDAMWVERVPGSARRRYEARVGAPITQLTPAGSFASVPSAASYLAATFTTNGSPEMPPGMDLSRLPALAAAIPRPSSASAVRASELGSLGGRPGFFLLESGSFGHGPDSRGYLVVFVPQGWLTSSVGGDPRRLAISLDGRHLEGFDSRPARSSTFGTLGRRWRVQVASAPLTGLQTLLPWLAIAWPIAAALIAVLVGRGIVRRRRAEREVERIFDLSVDLLCIAGLDGHFKRVNPAFERTLGYTTQQLLSRPFLDFVHPDDRARSAEAMERLERGEKVVQFENRYMCADGSTRWLQWSTRPMPDEGLLYATARDVTGARRAADELRETHRMVKASRDELRLLADEQAALRRVATLVAQGVSATEVFDAVAAEMRELLGADSTQLLRYESDATATVVAVDGDPGAEMAAETCIAFGGEHAPSRSPPGPLAALRHVGPHSVVGAPIVVEGRVWGVVVAAWRQQQSATAEAEARMAQFTELVATAVANADSRAELRASRARVVAAADEARRRIERDLHDGSQQRLVSLALQLRAAAATVPPDLIDVRAQLLQTAQGLTDAVAELQEISRGIHPAILSKGGLAPAFRTLVRRSSVRVELDIRINGRLADGVEVAAYYVVSEALTNAAKHARASVVRIAVQAEDSTLELVVRDDGVGGADPRRGSGLIGLRDRVETLGGTIEIASGPRKGTSVTARIPIEGSVRGE
jgi:PAS domain S-box-containing protein